jgi:hypothetical protein
MGLSHTIRFAAAAVSISLAAGPAANAAPPPGPTAAAILKAPPRPLPPLSAMAPPPITTGPASAPPTQGPSITAGIPASRQGYSINDFSVSTAPPAPDLTFRWSFLPGASSYQVLSGPPGGPYALIANLSGLVHTYTYHPTYFSGTTKAFVVRAKLGTDLGGNSNEVIVTWPVP